MTVYRLGLHYTGLSHGRGTICRTTSGVNPGKNQGVSPFLPFLSPFLSPPSNPLPFSLPPSFWVCPDTVDTNGLTTMRTTWHLPCHWRPSVSDSKLTCSRKTFCDCFRDWTPSKLSLVELAVVGISQATLKIPDWSTDWLTVGSPLQTVA